MTHRLTMSAVVALCATAPSVASESYQLEKTHADLIFSINHIGFTEKHGLFRDVDATLQYDAQHPEKSQVNVTVKTDSLDTGFGPRDKDVKGDKFLDVTNYPEMRYVSSKITPGPKDTLLVDGSLTLHGVTKPLTLHATLNKVGPNPFDMKPTIGFTATGSLKRSDFAISTYLPMIGDLVTITIDAEFNRNP